MTFIAVAAVTAVAADKLADFRPLAKTITALSKLSPEAEAKQWQPHP